MTGNILLSFLFSRLSRIGWLFRVAGAGEYHRDGGEPG